MHQHFESGLKCRKTKCQERIKTLINEKKIKSTQNLT